ncbi:MAG: hypothetical protein JNN12_13015 [Bacteroidetes Order II. Incertae sedis bacterium]|nr:hypothetical protein [Bacteroidetes Order II. bacterium]
MKPEYLLHILLAMSLLNLLGCDYQSNVTSNSLSKTHRTWDGLPLAMSELETIIPKAWNVQTAIDSTSSVTTTNGHFPMEIKPKRNRNFPLQLLYGAAIISDGNRAIAHLELSTPLSDMPIGTILSANEMDGLTQQVAQYSIEKTSDGYSTQVHFLGNNTLFHEVLVTVVDQEADFEKPLFHKRISRTHLASGIKDMFNLGFGECVGSAEEIDLCEQYSTQESFGFMQKKSLSKQQGGLAMAKQKICVPSSVANWSLDWSCWTIKESNLSNVILQKYTTQSNNTDFSHIRLDFRPIYDSQNPTNIQQPQIVISAITINMGIEIGIAGYKFRTLPFKLPIDTAYFQKISGLKFGALSTD